MHTFETKIRLQHTDAAGVTFFARLFELAHLAFEDMLDAVGHPLRQDLAGAEVAYPIVHAEADYRAPMRLGQGVRIDVTVKEVRSRVFKLGYAFTLADGTHAADAETIHAAVGRGVRDATTLPDDLVAALQSIM